MKIPIYNLNTVLVTILRGVTSQLKVVDVIVNKSFRDRPHYLYRELLISGNCPLMQAGNIRRLSEALVWQWVKTAWNDSSLESIIMFLKFKKGLKYSYGI